MNIFDLLSDLVPGLSQARGVSREQPVQAAGWGAQPIGRNVARGARQALPLMAEDDQIVNTNQGRMPLWAVEGGIQRLQPPTQPDSIGSRFIPSQRIEIPSQTKGINGAINPLSQMRRGFTPYSPGEGPRTNFNRYR